jgi:hypothetical protein
VPSRLVLSLDSMQVPEDFDAELFRLCLGAAIRRIVPPQSRVSPGVDFTELGISILRGQHDFLGRK